MRKTAAVVTAALAMTFGATPARAAVPPEGCALAYPASTTCSYVATQVATYVGTGPFHVRVTYVDGAGARRTRFDVMQPAGTARPLGISDDQQVGIGDAVEAEITGPGGALAIGNPGATPHSQVAEREAPRLTGDTTPVHDPAIAAANSWYYVYSTGAGIPIRRSKDLTHWEAAGRVFASDLPSWAAQVVPGADAPWAPDISFFGGRWHLYYVVSTFGAKRSVIAMATNTTLDPRDPRYAWRDEGPVIDSRELTDGSSVPTDYNALDPNVVIDGRGRPHLVFGSFYGGIKTVALDADTGHVVHSVVPTPLAANVQEYTAVEGAFMIRRGGWYYLFASYDYCCRGTDSTYNVRVGRARSVRGPFVDDVGVPMLAGGGRYVLSSKGDMRGPGHNAILQRGSRYDIVFHWYDAAHAGTPTLGILPLHWSADGWPVVAVERRATRASR